MTHLRGDITGCSVVIDITEGSWEATVAFSDGCEYHYESTDPHTLLAAVGRDLAAERPDVRGDD